MDYFLGIIVILVAHYIADFYCQPRHIAISKSEDIVALLIHILLYASAFLVLFFLGLYFVVTGIPLMYTIQIAVGVTVVNSILHYGIDFYTSKINKYYWKKKQTRKFSP